MKIGVLGGGISGLSIGKLLYENHEVEILEKEVVHGGIARTKIVDGIAYHVTGGHCFNSKFPEVLDFIFSKVMPENEWHIIQRDAAIKFRGQEITYPIEFSVKQIFEFDRGLAMNIVKDFLNSSDDNSYNNLEDWFRKKFGNSLAEEYFIPYNKKIWNKDPKEMNPNWVEGKLPIPNKETFFQALIENVNDKMPHSFFYYPNSNNQNTFIDKLASGLDIKYNVEVNSISIDSNRNFIINDQFKYDILINTLPLNILPKLINNCPSDILEAASKLEYNKVSTVLWESQPTKRTWTYLPDPDIMFHRYIHIGNFYNPARNYTITEVVGEKSFKDMVANGQKDPFLIKPLDFNVSNHAYVVFNEGYNQNKIKIINYLSELGIFSLGRFAEWEYYNMDVCIKSAIDLKAQILNLKTKNFERDI